MTIQLTLIMRPGAKALYLLAQCYHFNEQDEKACETIKSIQHTFVAGKDYISGKIAGMQAEYCAANAPSFAKNEKRVFAKWSSGGITVLEHGELHKKMKKER